MKYQLDTAPVWDAYKKGGECPLCTIETDVNSSLIRYFLGESVMEPAQRIEVNERFFCAGHLAGMYQEGNRLGLALMTHTYIGQTLSRMRERSDHIRRSASSESHKPSFLRKKLKQDITSLDPIVSSCVICDRIDQSMQRYLYTLLYLYEHDPDFREVYLKSRGLCQNHLKKLLAMAAESLSGKTLEEFIPETLDIQLSNLERIGNEVEWFTQKFDYRHQDEPWGNSKDSVMRAINKLRHTVIRSDDTDPAVQ